MPKLYRKKYLCKLPEGTEDFLVRLPVAHMPDFKKFQEDIEQFYENAMKIQQSKLPAAERALRLLDTLHVEGCERVYTLVPLNLLLWLYNLGLSQERSYKFFMGIADGISKARKSRKELPGMKTVSAPLSKRATELMSSASESFREEKHRNFGMLQAALTMFVCSIAGKNEYMRLNRLMEAVAPDMFLNLGPVPMLKSGKPCHMYANAYTSAKTVPWISMLFQVADLEQAVLTCKILVIRAEKQLEDVARIRGMTNTDMIARICTYLHAVQCEIPERCREFAFLGGKYGFW